MKNKKSWALSLMFLLILIQSIDIQAQNFSRNYVLTWTAPLKVTHAPQHEREVLHFEGAQYTDNMLLPALSELVPVPFLHDTYDYILSNEEYLPLTQQEIALLPKDFTAKKIMPLIIAGTDRKKTFIYISLIPIVQKEDGKWYKLRAFQLLVEGKTSKSGGSKRTFAAHSILNNGHWYQVGVTKTGITKVTYEDLLALKATSSPIASANLSIFGNGSGMLPERAGDERYDDLAELPVLVFDGGDGIFGAGDYFIFYAEGPHPWNYNASDNRFSHKMNIYSDYAYYFINIEAGIGAKRRITTQNNNALTATATANTYTHYDFQESDLVAFAENGQTWVGDEFGTTLERTYTFSLPAFRAQSARLSLCVSDESSASNSFSIAVNNTTIGQLALLQGVNNSYKMITGHYSFTPNNAQLNIKLTFNPATPSAVAHLDWIELQAQCQLTMHSAQFPFCVPEQVSAGQVVQYNISNANGNTTVWDVTRIDEVTNMAGTLNGNIFSFKSPADQLRKFLVFNKQGYNSVTVVGSVAAQNLHGSSQVDMVMVVYPDFIPQAQKLADFRRANDHLSVKIVTPQEVYNEFSSGAIDPTAIRDYMKMIYEKSGGTQPQYLLLFGRPSYDYRGRVTNGPKLFVPNYQYDLSKNSISETTERALDDYFGCLDDNEGANGGLIDVAIGRFPSSNTTDASTAVEKTLNYSSPVNIVTDENSSQVSNFGDWRNVATFVCDDDLSNFIRNSDHIANIVTDSNLSANVEKIFSDAYQRVSYSGGVRYPDVNAAINNRMRRGALVINYNGHGSGGRWAVETILEVSSDVPRWDNKYNQPLMVTLTCNFGGYDRAAISGAEEVFRSAKGGAAALITTSRTAFTGSNDNYAVSLYSRLYSKINGRNATIGELNRTAKNRQGGLVNSLNMIYMMGDPAMRLAIPEFNVVTDSINGMAIDVATDTLKAFTKVTLKGRVLSQTGNLLSNFNGIIYPTVFDKKTRLHTLQNVKDDSNYIYYEFDVQKNILFKGKATVHQGYFAFTFIVPKDINYTYGNGKISYYANTSSEDAAGYCNSIIVGGISDNAAADTKGPDITLYMNDENFVNGGTTNQNPTLLVKLSDEFGINTTGNGIGHDLTAILDNNSTAPVSLNDYYQAVKDSFNCGTVYYPYQDLAVGKHTVKVRAWDIYNNMSEKSLDFVVADDQNLALDHVLNYPNPFTTSTAFYFEHNKPGQPVEIVINIYTISGKIVKSFKETQITNGNRSNPIYWNGRDEYGDKLAKGVYIYHLKIRDANGKTAEKIEKMAIL
ncbi:MAG: type IX secretion system sortase PorU [Bacteroidales bacterium]|nr:type IX secretion system sortase PorU [Bacteroidales bacterium]